MGRESPEDGQPGKIVAFYSFKGGTGRSMALANIACLLAARATRPVLMIDWDLEAPGLHRYFSRELFKSFKGSEDAQRSYPGLIDLFVELRGGLDGFSPREPAGAAVAAALLQQVTISDFVVPTDRLNLHLLKAGAFDLVYASKVSGFDWQDFYARASDMLRMLSERLAEDYEWVLIDSRTGLTDTSGICTMLMPETLVVVFTPNRQSVEGVVDLVRQAAKHRSASNDLRPLMVYPLPSRVEASEPTLRKLWRHGGKRTEVPGFQEAFENAFADIYQLDGCDLTAYFDEVQIQHVPRYAYGEDIAVLAEESRDRLSLTRSFERFLGRLVAETLPWEYQGSTEDEEQPPVVDRAGAPSRLAIGIRNDVEQLSMRMSEEIQRLARLDLVLSIGAMFTLAGLALFLALQAERYALWIPLGMALAASALVISREIFRFQPRIALFSEQRRALRSIAADLENNPDDPVALSASRSKLYAIQEQGFGSFPTRKRRESGRVYISYRRGDSSGFAGRLFDGLTQRLSSDRVIMDIDSIMPGQDFQDALARQIESTSVFLVVIGPDWLGARDAAGRPRLDSPTDLVHAEVSFALANGRRVIPVLVGGAAMPSSSELPGPLQELARRQAIALSPRSWESDVQRLVEVIDRMSEDIAA